MKRTGGLVQSETEGYGSKIREARLLSNLIQADLAKKVGVSRQTIIAMESGSYSPSVFLALLVATQLDSTVEALWGNP